MLELDIKSPQRGAYVGGVRIDDVDLAGAARAMTLRRDHGMVVHLCNAHNISLARRDRRYRALLNAGTLNLPDGAPVAWLLHILGGQSPGRPVRGADLMRHVLSAGTHRQHFFYGGSPEVVAKLARLSQTVFGAKVVGVESPPFAELSTEALAAAAARLSRAGAEIVWVGLGTPKQDVVAHELLKSYSATYVCVGAAFDYLAGRMREAPRWMRGSGLEWLFRLMAEPRRLAGRYLIGNFRFLSAVLHGPTRRA